MKTLKITTDNKISIIDVNLDDYRALQQEIGGYIETVHTQIMYDYFKAPVLMLVDEEGLIKNLPVNAVASHFYGYQKHGCTIAGDALFCYFARRKYDWIWRAGFRAVDAEDAE